MQKKVCVRKAGLQFPAPFFGLLHFEEECSDGGVWVGGRMLARAPNPHPPPPSPKFPKQWPG